LLTAWPTINWRRGASWDPEQLRNELQELGFAGFDLDLIGFEPDQLETILAGLGSSGLTDPDSIPEVPDQPVSRCGDLWLLGNHHRVGCGGQHQRRRCWARVLAEADPHLMVADPPYGGRLRAVLERRAGTSAPARLRAGQSPQRTIAPTGGRPMRCSLGMSPYGSGTGALHGDPFVRRRSWRPAGCGCALRSSGLNSTSR